MLNKNEKQEWLDKTISLKLREDSKYLSANRHNPFLKEGEVDIDKLIEFQNAFNELINHQQKPFKPIIDNRMRL